MDIANLYLDAFIKQRRKEFRILNSMFDYYDREIFNNSLPLIFVSGISEGDIEIEGFIYEMDRTEKHPHLFINNAFFGQYRETELLKVSNILLEALEQETGQQVTGKEAAFNKWFTQCGAELIRSGEAAGRT